MTEDFQSVVRFLSAGRTYLDKLGEGVTDLANRTKLIRQGWDMGLLDIDEGVVLHLEGESLGVADAFYCAKESLEGASKSLSHAIRLDTEAILAQKMGHKKYLEQAGEDVENALKEAKEHAEIAYRYGELCLSRRKGVNVPTFGEK